MLTKKKMTKLLNANYRKSIIDSVSKQTLIDKKVYQYSRYVTDRTIFDRNQKEKDNKNANYGFSPINPICAILNDGTIEKLLIEFNIINHFLKINDGDSAVEVVMCILISWIKENKNIKDFDIDAIDNELSRLEKEYLSQSKTKDTNSDSSLSNSTN